MTKTGFHTLVHKKSETLFIFEDMIVIVNVINDPVFVFTGICINQLFLVRVFDYDIMT